MSTAERVLSPAPPTQQQDVGEKPRRSSFADVDTHQRQQTAAQFQAEQMYPHHPLLGGPEVPPLMSEGGWIDSPMQSAMMPGGPSGSPAGPSFINPFTSNANATVSLPVSATQTPVMMSLSGSPNSMNLYATQANLAGPYSALPMRVTGSEQGLASPNRWQGGYAMSPTWEWGYKKRACDNCNQSKVRCDNGDPCQRCSNRKVACTYNKPQKSRSIANFGQRMSVGMSSSGSGMSSSPSAGSYSPYRSTIQPPLTAPPPRTGQDARRMTAPAMGGSEYVIPHTAPFIASQSQPGPQSWGMTPYLSNINPALLPGNQPEHFSPHAQGTPLPGPSGAFRPGSQSFPEHSTSMGATDSASSLQGLHNGTPALTASHSTSSPDSLEETRERSGSQGGPSTGLVFSSGSGGLQKPLGSSDQQYPVNAAPMTASPLAFMRHSLDSNVTDSTMASVPWPNSASTMGTLDPRVQFRNSVASVDEDAVSVPGSVRASACLELDDANHTIDHRRRSSAGTWANALNDLSLQDGAAAAAVVANAGMDMSIPFVAAQVAQAFQARRPSFPMFPMASSIPGLQQDLSKPQSFGDAKDLWKLFMSEPMTGATPSKEGFDSLDIANRQMTPRPGLGKRNLSTMSKRNSMPELMTPSLAQTFTQSHFDVAAPGATGPAHQSHAEGSEVDDQWRSAISQRHASFDIAPGNGAGSHSFHPTKAELMDGFGSRPLPAVFQSSALHQTLAPERTLSFGLQSFDPQTPPGQSRLRQSQTPLKYSGSAAARPGAKRLSSQLLENAADKKRDSAAEDNWAENRTAARSDAKAQWVNTQSYPHGGTVSLPVTATSTPMMGSAMPLGNQSSWPPGSGIQAVSRAS